MDEDYNLAERYRIVRKHLDRLGYRQALSLDALPLIERLLADLIQTTDSLKHYKAIAQDNIEACSQLQLATEPYKCDNARLVQECNKLHLKLLESNETHQKQIKELKKQVRKLEHDCNDLQLVSSRNIKKVKELESESAGKSSKILELQGKCCKPVISSANLATKKRACYPLRRPTLESDPLPRSASSSSALPSSSNVDPHVVDLLGMADHRMNCLNREVTKLKGDLSVQSDNINALKSQLATKEKEIMRLKKMLDGGRPFSAVTKDCFCIKTDKNHFTDGGETKILERAKQDLEERLKDSMAKQHEAMSRALKLAERNEELEKELRDIDHIALAVEADCNSAVQENNRRVSRLQEKVENLMTQVHVLESELTVERREAQELRADLEACKLEKRNIQRVLESTLDEKKQMTDRINQLTIIEKDLNDKLEKLTKEVIQLESSNNILKTQIFTIGGGGGGGGGGDDREKHKDKGEKNDKNKGKKILKKKTAAKAQSTSPTINKQNLNGHKEDEVSKDVTNAGTRFYENEKAENEKDLTIESLKKTIGRLETERDYYRNEYNKFREEFNLISNGDNADLWTQACELRRQLNEKEQAMAELQREKKALDREKFNLEARLQTSKSQQRRPCISCGLCSPCRPTSTGSAPSGDDAASTKAMIDRLERERDTARGDVNRLAEERDALRERLKIATDAHTSEQRRLRENLLEAETRLKQLETERHDLMLSQGTRRATINGLEDQLEDLRQELKRTKEELTTQRTQYFQLRALQEQTDQALGDVQGQLGQSETELNKMIDHKRNIEQQQMQLDNQVKELKQECNMLRSNLAQLDQEKDQLLMNLDEKTERIAALEREIRFKEQQGNGLEQQVVDFQHKYQICVDQTAEQERQLRTMEVEMNNLQRQLASASADRENAIRENARIQDDLASVTCECRNLQRELEASRAESYDLKRQLQTYVTEVRRAEELLNRKENERSEMLNHFRSLSLEATVLETNNQSLESEAAEARGALQTAQDRLLDLERQIADRDCLIRGYETQIAELTQNVASMETQLHQQGEQRKRAEADLNAVRDLCVKLDQQKESLEAQLGDKESMRVQCETQLARLRAEQNMVQDQMSRDNAAVDRLEAMLNQARQESLSNQATNQELQSEMTRLKQKISDLQNKLLEETSELRRYQNQAAEYSRQISELRRQMTNERFDRARKEEESRRPDSPHNLVKQTCPPCSAFQGPTPAPRPDPKSVNQWKIPAPSSRTPEESREGCSCKPEDLKKEAHRTNRFNTNSSHNSTSSCLTPCNRHDSNTGVANDYKPHEKDDVPCINIIVKPISDLKTDQKDKGIQIVEITAVTENNKHSINDINTSLPSQYRSSSKEKVKVEKKDVKIQTELDKNIHDSSTQTTKPPTDQRIICVSPTNKTKSEITVRNSRLNDLATGADTNKQNRGVQFRDNRRITDDISCSNRASSIGMNPDTRSLLYDNSSCNSTITRIADNQHVKTTGSGTSMSPIEHFDSMETLYKLVNSKDKSDGSSDFKSCVKKSTKETQEKLSDRIKRNINKLETGSCISTQSSLTNTSHGNQQESVKSQTRIVHCIDICKDIASRAELFKIHSDKNSPPMQNTSTLTSVFSNNPPIPMISLDSTETPRWESPLRNKSPKTTIPDSFDSPTPNNISCCSNQKFINKDIPCESKNVTLDKDSTNVSCGQRYSINKERKTVSDNVEKYSDTTTEDTEKYGNNTDTRGFLSDETTNFSRLGINGTSFIGTKSMNTSDEMNTLKSATGLHLMNNKELVKENTLDPDKCCKSIAIQTHSMNFLQPPDYSHTATSEFGEKLDVTLSKPNTRSFLKASDLTRPEFIRMLTEVKEHTCSLELQLSAMNEALKRKQASRNRALTSTLKNYESVRQDPVTYETRNKKLKIASEYSCCSLHEDNSISESETLNDGTCCGGTNSSEPNESYTYTRSPKKLKAFSHTMRCSEPEQINVVEDELNISIVKRKPRKPVFKTKRSYLWAASRESDNKMRKHKPQKSTPSIKSMTIPKILSRSVSPNSLMMKSKIDISCSPIECCEIFQDSLQTMLEAGRLSPLSKPEVSDVTVRSASHTTSNPSFNRRTVRPAFMSSTLKKKSDRSSNSKYKAQSINNSNYKMPLEPSDCRTMNTSMPSSDNLHTSKHSNHANNSSRNEKMETASGTEEQSREYLTPPSLFKLKRSEVTPRLGIKRSSFKFRSKGRPKSIPSNTRLCSSVSSESFHESSSNISSQPDKTEHDATKRFPFRLKKLGVVPRLKLISDNSRISTLSHLEKVSSQSIFDPGCCSTAKEDNDEIVKENRKRGKDYFAYKITTKQNTPFSVNNFSKFDSEEEVSSTDYGFNKSGKEYCGKESKDNVNDKKRRSNSVDKNFIRMIETSGLNEYNTSERRSFLNNSQSSQYRDSDRYNSKNKNDSQSVSSDLHSGKIQESNNNLSDFNQTNCQSKTSKCTIRVTVSLDDAASNEEVKKNLETVDLTNKYNI